MEYILEILGQIGIYIILAMSLNLMCGLTGLLQLGHAGFFAVGAYAAGLVTIYWFQPAWGYGNYAIGAAAAMAAASVCALVVGIPCLRLRGDYLAIATLGFGEIVRICLNNIEFPGCKLTYDEPFGGATGIELPFEAYYSQWWFIWIHVIVIYILLLNLKRSAIGRAFMAIREDEIAARTMGINPARCKIASFLFCAMFAGLAGALFAYNQISLSPNDFTLLRTIEVLLMVVLGGLGSFSGSALAAVILVALPELLRFAPSVGGIQVSEYRQLIFAALLILLIRIVPNGLLGVNEFHDLPRRAITWLRRR